MLQHLVLESQAGSFTANTAIEFFLTRTLSEEVLAQSVPLWSKLRSRIITGTAQQARSCGSARILWRLEQSRCCSWQLQMDSANRVALQVATLQKGGASQEDLQGTLSQLRERPAQVMQSRVTGKCISERPSDRPSCGVDFQFEGATNGLGWDGAAAVPPCPTWTSHRQFGLTVFC